MPAAEPISLVEAKLHLRLDYEDEDDLVENIIIPAARQTVEEVTNRALMPQIWAAFYSNFASYLILPRPPVRIIDHVKYYSSDGTPATLATNVYEGDLTNEPAIITTAYAQQWPSFTARSTRPVEVQFQCGYASAADVPGPIKSAMLLIIGHLFRNRENVVSGDTSVSESKLIAMGAIRLLDNFRVMGCE